MLYMNLVGLAGSSKGELQFHFTITKRKCGFLGLSKLLLFFVLHTATAKERNVGRILLLPGEKTRVLWTWQEVQGQTFVFVLPTTTTAATKYHSKRKKCG